MVMKKPSVEQRKVLGTFLASCRARLKPGDLGLPVGSRRTPGLRREEVAVLLRVPAAPRGTAADVLVADRAPSVKLSVGAW